MKDGQLYEDCDQTYFTEFRHVYYDVTLRENELKNTRLSTDTNTTGYKAICNEVIIYTEAIRTIITNPCYKLTKNCTYKCFLG